MKWSKEAFIGESKCFFLLSPGRTRQRFEEMLRRDAALSVTEFICGEKVRWVSKVTPKIFGRLSNGSR